MVVESWRRIRSWAKGNAPAMLADLNAGASEEDLSVLERGLGMKIPGALRQSLMVHDGEDDGWPCKVFADHGAYLGSGRIVQEWEQRLEIANGTESMVLDEDLSIEEQIAQGIIEVDGPVKPSMYRREWIPVMDCNGDVFWALDMDPAPGGTAGQLIEVDWEGCKWKVVAASFESFLAEYAARLESGVYQIVDGLPTMEDGNDY